MVRLFICFSEGDDTDSCRHRLEVGRGFEEAKRVRVYCRDKESVEFMTNLFNKVRDSVKEKFNNNEWQMRHFDRTVYWLQQLKPDADEALLIAGISHDIERAYRDPKEGFGKTVRRFIESAELARHSEEGADIIAELLEKEGASKDFIERVWHLISKHEVGGDADQNLLKDADSLSFVENNSQIFISRLDTLGYEAVREKFDWMYNRISDPKAKEIATPFYEKMMKELEEAAISPRKISSMFFSDLIRAHNFSSFIIILALLLLLVLFNLPKVIIDKDVGLSSEEQVCVRELTFTLRPVGTFVVTDKQEDKIYLKGYVLPDFGSSWVATCLPAGSASSIELVY